jgi:hypothetical protein
MANKPIEDPRLASLEKRVAALEALETQQKTAPPIVVNNFTIGVSKNINRIGGKLFTVTTNVVTSVVTRVWTAAFNRKRR